MAINGLSLEEALRRARAAAATTAQRMGDPVGDQLDAMRAVVLADEGDGSAPDRWRRLRFMAHDLKGYAAGFGHPLVGEAASGLCGFLDEASAGGAHVDEVARAHLDTADRLYRDPHDEARGRALLDDLARARTERG